MLRYLSLLPVVIVLAGCQGSPVGDLLIGPEKLAEQDDAYCRSIGGVPGTPGYQQCRLYKDQMRAIRHAEARASIQQSLRDYSAREAYNSRSIHCTTVTTGVFSNTDCR